MTDQVTIRREQYHADKALIMAKYTPLLKAMSHTDPGYQSLWEERARKVCELTEAYERDNLRTENEILREQLASVLLIAQEVKRLADLGAEDKPGSDAWDRIASEAHRLVCAL